MPEPEPEPEEPPEEDWRPKRTEPAPAPRGQAAAPVQPRERDASFTTPDEAIHEARAFVEGLTKSDKLAAGGVALLVVSLFLPWRETASNGDELGIVTSGILAALIGLGTLGAIFVRLRKPIPNIPPIAPWAAQAGLAALSVILCLVFVVSAYDGTTVPALVGNGTMRASTPSLGAILGLAGAVVGLVGTVLAFKEKQE
jgi:hypothetical protein